MQEWMKISLLLCTFGFLKELRPSEPFIVDFLTGPWRNVTSDEINRDVFPVGTYSSLAQLVIVFLVTDFLRYKPLIILTGLSGIIVWSMLLWTTSKLSLQLVEIAYGTYVATEVAYFTYIYAKVNREHYLKVSSHTRAAIFCSRFIAATSSQILVYFKLMDYRELNYISLAAQICATAWAIFLPTVKTSLYFHRDEKSTALMEKGKDDDVSNKAAFKLLWLHFKMAYTNHEVVKWSVWYALGMCGYIQIISYCQVLWDHIDNSQEILWNGAVEAALTLLGTIVALGAGYLTNERLGQKKRLWTLSILTIISGFAVLLAAMTHLRWVSYLGYLIFGVIYSFLLTIASAEVAKHLVEDSFGLVFGINTLVALTLQTILTIAVVSENGFSLDIVGQFTVYGCLFIVTGIIYLVVILYEMIWKTNVSDLQLDGT